MKNIIYKIAIVLLMVQVAHAQSARVFLKGTGITVETVVAGYTDGNYIDVWNVDYSTNHEKFVSSTGSVYNRALTANATSGVLTFTKAKSKSSNLFNDKIKRGNNFAKIEIAFAKAIVGANPQYQTYMKYSLEDVFVVSIRDNDDFTETIQLVMKKLKIEYKPTDPVTGQLGTAIIYGWNFGTKTSF